MFPIKTVTELNEEELIKCNELVLRRRQRITVPFILALILIYILSIVFIKAHGGTVQPHYWVLGAVLVCYLLLYTVFLKLIVRRNVKKLLERTGSRTMTCEFYEDKLEVSTEGEKVNGSSSYEYSLLTSVVETEDSFYPYISRSILPVSKRGLSADETAALRELFLRFVPEKKYKHIDK